MTFSIFRRAAHFKDTQTLAPISPTSAFAAPEPLRAEIFSAFQMAQHGEKLAASHVLSEEEKPDRLLPRLDDNERIINQSCDLIAAAVKKKHQITPASEWLLDNLHLIEEQITLARKHLPKGYSRGLPKLGQGEGAGSPRVYTLALEVISHGDGRIEAESLTSFIESYQKTAPLQLGELWAVPIMLRLALIENLRRVAARITISRINKNLANQWADRMVDAAEKDPASLIVIVADMARSKPPFEPSFVAEIARRLQGKGPTLALPLTWIEQRLEENGQSIELLIHQEVQQQAIDQVSVANSIGSLRLLDDMDWRKFVESLSIVENILRDDPSGFYGRMDFATRDLYRHRVETVAKITGESEGDIARHALSLSKEAEPSDTRKSHVGHYLAGEGLDALEKKAGATLPPGERLLRFASRRPLTVYLGFVGLITADIAYTLSARADSDGAPFWLLVLLAIFAALAASHLAIAMVNWFATVFSKPDPLPRLDFSGGVPDEARTLVTVPTLLGSVKGIDDLCDLLEVRFLANRDRNVSFSLLTDFKDADSESVPGDNALLSRAVANIEALNKKYAEEGRDVFFLFHRPRLWNASEGKWMGFERKRGKLSALNEFILHRSHGAFSKIVGNTDALHGVRYVITLDSDTQLPRDSAQDCIGAMAHPLNRPVYDMGKGRVTQGYAIIQPRIASSLPGSNSSLYAQLCGGEPGIDPYTRAVSDVYQDAFHEGSFIGKGIYEAETFETVLKGTLPDNRILSHDLLEGCYVRSGLLSDVQLYEAYPSRYAEDVSRRHRWIRGDWQIAAWIFPTVRNAAGARVKNPLSALSRWKIADNLRRSLVPQSLLLLFLYGITLSPSPLFWSAAVIALLFIPSLYSAIFDLSHKSKDIPLSQHLAASAYAAGRHFGNALFALATLPYEALYSTDAILRTLWRMWISKKKLLEWTPSGDASSGLRYGLFDIVKRMWIGPVIAAGLFYVMMQGDLETGILSAIVALLWFFSPLMVWKLSLPLRTIEPSLSNRQKEYLGRTSRKTWEFFEKFVGPDDNWLPPDNFQESPVAVIAHRTSPTNMGLALLSTVAAGDFGYIPPGIAIRRIGQTLSAMNGLERYRGHFYNWYDTQSLSPLHPMYVSAVDSGNLAAHLLVLRTALLEIIDRPVIHPAIIGGLLDTAGVLREACGKDGVAFPEELSATIEMARTRPLQPAFVKETLLKLIALAESVEIPETIADSEAAYWVSAFVRQCRHTLDDILWILPWHDGDTAAEGTAEETVPTIRQLAAATAVGTSATVNVTPQRRIAAARASERISVILTLAKQAADMAEMEWDFLYDKNKRLLSIGYHVSERRLDTGFYDLLASEARLGTFVAIAQGKLPQESWFALGRQLKTGGKTILTSWSGSMFEYLMPILVMPSFDKTLLDQTCKAAVSRQIDYGNSRGVPWGISESGYYMFDANLNYQYRAFGVPGLGMKRDLADDLVIAPYASVMGLMVMPEESCRNLERLSADGYEGRYGFYEAIDFTPARLPRGRKSALVQSFMVHHQGMAFLSFAHLLLGQPMQQRFTAEPMFRSAMLLLHEKIPRVVAFQNSEAKFTEIAELLTSAPKPTVRIFTTPLTQSPEVNLLSNGSYHVMISNAGGGYSRWKDLAVTRWREDATRDNWGAFCYIRDAGRDGTNAGAYWSNAYQPTLKTPDNYEAIFSEGRAEFRRRDGGIDTHTEIVVSPEDDIELRRIKISNRSSARRTIEVTSYSEVVMAPFAADAAHPAFSNLFMQTEILHKRHAIVCARRPRSEGEQPPFMFHLMTAHGADVADISYETDRMKFTGRGRTLQSPQAMDAAGALSGSEGPVLDPVAAVRYRLTLGPEQTATIDLVTGVAPTREVCDTLIDKYQDAHLTGRVLEMAWTHGQVALRQMNAGEADGQLYAAMTGAIIYPGAALRTDPSVVIRNRKGQSALWSYAISGDLPIVLVKIRDISNIALVRQTIQAHTYWRQKGLSVDLVIWNEDNAGYRQNLQDQIFGLIAASVESHIIDRPGGIFVRAGDQISPDDKTLFESVACMILSDTGGSLEEQVSKAALKAPKMPRLQVRDSLRGADAGVESAATMPSDIVLSNGYGGFVKGGREYAIYTAPGQTTPAPWSNVIANPVFGTVISERGQAYTWALNAHEYRLTPWHNDPVADASGEAYYVRDEQSGEFWQPMPGSGQPPAPYVTRHGFGYSVFDHARNGIETAMTVFVDPEDAVKFTVLKIKNTSKRARKLSATGYAEWVLGELRHKSKNHIVTEQDASSGAIIARNAYNTDFAQLAAFFDADDPKRTISADRREFIGRGGTMQNPAAMERAGLSGRTGALLDPCAAIQIVFDLEPGQVKDIVFRLGVGLTGVESASALARKHKGTEHARNALLSVQAHWDKTLGAVTIETPDESLNMLANGWLIYQTIACRLWARSGYYQSGGAFGFRDQLQDAMALIHTRPDLLRQQILLHAAHQFPEGDAQHWWHPPTDRGVRTRCSDDYLWLPLAVTRYITATGDDAILNEPVNFIEGRLLNPNEEAYYDLPSRSAEAASLYDHCVRALKNGFRFGERGLPLIGSCDWNDGMDKVGEHGKGESVWLGFFLHDILLKFAPVAIHRGDDAFARLCEEKAQELKDNIARNAWDGGWYRRAYFDDGTPLGSASSEECQIDSLSQSWAVLSGAGEEDRARTGMEAAYSRLVNKEHRLIQLLDPPFDRAGPNPGYIRGYVPGVRENGGQYTHAAIWMSMAFAAMNDAERAYELMQMINPLTHATTKMEADLYRAEPYVITADVYGVAPHTGRGGWSWYTGSAGWYYRLVVESVLGLTVTAGRLSFRPCLPEKWPSFRVTYRAGGAAYEIEVVKKPLGAAPSVVLDDVMQGGDFITLVDDGKIHQATFRIL